MKICAEFNVNEPWLRTGEGEMFVPFPINDLESIAEANNLSADYATAIRCLLKLPPVKQDIIVQFIKDVARKLEEK
ncbi:MAG: hypothetical protein LUD84_10995 [Clostridiales bacterium]|nr:hypothetical protein [Clostridiales bacterium]